MGARREHTWPCSLMSVAQVVNNVIMLCVDYAYHESLFQCESLGALSFEEESTLGKCHLGRLHLDKADLD